MANINKLSNGIRVVTEYLPHFRTAAFGVWICAGSVNETKEENGLAHMLEHMFFKGTMRKTAKELADCIALIGDDVNAFTSKEYTSFYGATTEEHVPALISLIGEMFFEAMFEDSDIKKEKRVILDEIDMYEDSPEDLVHDIIQGSVFKDHPLSNIISGSKGTVRRIKKEDLISFKDRYYIPSSIVISIAGKFNEEMIISQLENVFGVLSRKALEDEFIKSIDNNITESIYNKCFCYKYKNIEQVHINIAFPSINAGSKDRFAFTILNSLFGGSNNSRLFQTIREELGLAYSVYSYTSEFAQAGLFHIDVTMNPAKVMQVLHMITDIIKDIRNNGISEEELLIHKSQIRTELIMGSESIKAKMSSNAKSIFLRNYAVGLDENLKSIDAVTALEVNSLILNYLKIEKMSLCAAGAKDEIDMKIIKAWWKGITA